MSGGNRALGSKLGGGVPGAFRTALALAAVLLLTSTGRVAATNPLSEGATTEVTPPPAIWTMNLFDPALVRFQNPDWSACTAAAAESMLNIIAQSYDADMPPPRGSSLPTPSFRWQIDTSYQTQENILAYERQNMTMYWSSPGTDPHGWRNALNNYGWGSMYAGVYVDSAYPSFEDAAARAVYSVARTEKPVGILGWFGGHAQYVTGYEVQGDDPRVGDNYTILGVFLTDPLEADRMNNTFVPYYTWKTGPYYLRFSPYYHSDSPATDPIDGQVGYREWWGKWVIINAVQ